MIEASSNTSWNALLFWLYVAISSSAVCASTKSLHHYCKTLHQSPNYTDAQGTTALKRQTLTSGIFKACCNRSKELSGCHSAVAPT